MQNRVLLVNNKINSLIGIQQARYSNTHDLAKYISQKKICFVSFNNILSESSEVASIFKQNNS